MVAAVSLLLLKQFSLEAVSLLVVEAATWCLLSAVSRLLLKQLCCDEIRCLLLNLIIALVVRLIECWDLLDLLGQDLCNNVEYSEVRLFRW